MVKRVLVSCLVLCLLPLMFWALHKYQPISWGDRLYMAVRGTTKHKELARNGVEKWPVQWNHTPAEIYNMIRKETAGQFHYDAFNSLTEARGLMQVREIALRDIPGGGEYYKTIVMANGRKRVLNKQRIYDPYWNLYAGCAYYNLCKRRAHSIGAQRIGRFFFSEEELALMYYMAGIGTWQRSIKPMLEYIQ